MAADVPVESVRPVVEVGRLVFTEGGLPSVAGSGQQDVS